MIPESAAIQQSERTASRTVEGRAVVIVIDSQRLHTLNPVGTRIWELSDGRTLAEIVDLITTEFQVDRTQAMDDTQQFVEQLTAIGALSVQKAAP